MLGYESVWVAIVPVQMAELFFPRYAGQPWLRKRGAILAGIIFLFGCRIAWYGWTQQARPRLHAAPYHPPAGMIVLGLLAIAGLLGLAYVIRDLDRPSPEDRERTAPAWLGGLTAFVMGSAWFWLIDQQFVLKPAQPFWVAIAGGIAWAATALLLFSWWTSCAAWSDVHRLAATAGATLACMLAPYLTISNWSRIDIVGKAIFDLFTLAGFLILARRVFSGAKQQSPMASIAKKSTIGHRPIAG